MRLWHTSLIRALPRKQLISQWRELLAIKAAISKNNTPNHSLVNFVLQYSIMDFKLYSELVYKEMLRRNFKAHVLKYAEIQMWSNSNFKTTSELTYSVPYKTKMNKRYLYQCYYNLQEKYDCGMISQTEFDNVEKILTFYKTKSSNSQAHDNLIKYCKEKII